MPADLSALTLVTRKQAALALALGESWLAAHPGSEFTVVLADREDAQLAGMLPSGFRLLGCESLGVPDFSGFLYRHTDASLAEALKPWALRRLLDEGRHARVVCLDPDSLVYAPLDLLDEALDSCAVALLPRARRPYHDGARPGDLELLRHGSLDPGLVALREHAVTRELLEWWCRKTFLDSLEEQRAPNPWIDLLHAFRAEVGLLREPGLGLSWWNLHERQLTRAGEAWRVDGAPLVLARFPGFSPLAPQLLAPGQDRHLAVDSEALEALVAHYAAALLRHGHLDWMNAEQGHDRLGNGVLLPREALAAALRWADRNGVAHPDALAEPDAFCRFLMRRGVLPGADGDMFLPHFLAPAPAATPEWGALAAHAGEDALADPVTVAFARLRAGGRQDVLGFFAAQCTSSAAIERFADWFAAEGSAEMGFDATTATAVRAAVPGMLRVLNEWFLRGDLQQAFPSLWHEEERQAFAAWLRAHRHELEVDAGSIALFIEFCRAAGDAIEKMRFLYQHYGREDKDGISLYALERIRHNKRINLPPGQLAEWLARAPELGAADHLRFAPRLPHGAAAEPSLLHLAPETAFAFRARCATEAAPSRAINLAGYLDSATGMGESGRSLRATLAATGRGLNAFCIPGTVLDGSDSPLEPFRYGWPRADAAVSITAANADSVDFVRRVIPPSHWAPLNVGYWVWESERLPRRQAARAEGFEALWAPSRYAAAAIAATTGREVGVLPCSLDLAALDRASPARARFGLPEQGLLVGYFLDTRSSVERKNVDALLAAFTAAFAPEDDAWLVLKISGRPRLDPDYCALRERLRAARVIVLDGVLSRADTLDLMRSLDVYASLHRAEGFGLTCAEAMALGLPVVASGYSGNLDFMSGTNSLLVPCRVIETERAFGPYPAGTRWGDPDGEAAAALLRGLRDADARRALGMRASADVRARLAPAQVATEAIALLAALEGALSG